MVFFLCTLQRRQQGPAPVCAAHGGRPYGVCTFILRISPTLEDAAKQIGGLMIVFFCWSMLLYLLYWLVYAPTFSRASPSSGNLVNARRAYCFRGLRRDSHMRGLCVCECDRTFCGVCSVLPPEGRISWDEERGRWSPRQCVLSLPFSPSPDPPFLFPVKGAKRRLSSLPLDVLVSAKAALLFT